ncbi:hypothetical protein S3E15_00565 [Bacillus mycoides]|uniref:Uncharacterized protein n=1 Tax=Bacillus mycoides TaxID=1405 RepID=A0AAP7WEQ3_BACMY|nr:hypothetical protein bcere0007_24240 [Bacillus mycoides]EEL99145.1 hypothetical protein bmyco0001_23320 [Bacillus mycoides DSM 2048]KUH41039.1 hypothetical protein M2E15_4260 [Bacillus mycoides]KZE04729.1 hypothetical protein B4117_3830 [Bacillus mycoides]OSX92077.1 hypothetical protein BTJ44_01152 [Bacillus mycoides]
MVANIDYLENPFVLFDGDIVPHIGHSYLGLFISMKRIE